MCGFSTLTDHDGSRIGPGENRARLGLGHLVCVGGLWPTAPSRSRARGRPSAAVLVVPAGNGKRARDLFEARGHRRVHRVAALELGAEMLDLRMEAGDELVVLLLDACRLGELLVRL